MVMLRLIALFILVLQMVSLTEEQFRARVAVPLMATASLQTLLGFAQMIKGSPLGLSGWGEQPELRAFGDAFGASGTTLSPYILAGLGVLPAIILRERMRDVAADAPSVSRGIRRNTTDFFRGLAAAAGYSLTFDDTIELIEGKGDQYLASVMVNGGGDFVSQDQFREIGCIPELKTQ